MKSGHVKRQKNLPVHTEGFLITEPGWNMHKPAEIGIDDFQSMRSPDGMYRTTPLKGLWSHQKGGFFHDGRFATLLDVVNHYNTFLGLNLSDQDKIDVVEYLKSLYPSADIDSIHPPFRGCIFLFSRCISYRSTTGETNKEREKVAS